MKTLNNVIVDTSKERKRKILKLKCGVMCFISAQVTFIACILIAVVVIFELFLLQKEVVELFYVTEPFLMVIPFKIVFISEKCMQDNIKKLNELKKKERQEKKVN